MPRPFFSNCYEQTDKPEKYIRLCLGSAAGVEIASFRSHADLQIPRFHFESSLASLECDAFCQQHSYVEFQRKGQLWLQSVSALALIHLKPHFALVRASDSDGPSTVGWTSCFASSAEQSQLSLGETKRKEIIHVKKRRPT